jgi:hypothetical protein
MEPDVWFWADKQQTQFLLCLATWREMQIRILVIPLLSNNTALH